MKIIEIYCLSFIFLASFFPCIKNVGHWKSIPRPFYANAMFICWQSFCFRAVGGKYANFTPSKIEFHFVAPIPIFLSFGIFRKAIYIYSDRAMITFRHIRILTSPVYMNEVFHFLFQYALSFTEEDILTSNIRSEQKFWFPPFFTNGL